MSRKDKIDAYEKERRKSPKYSEYHKEYYRKRKESGVHLDSYYVKQYGISLAEYNSMFEAQKGCCDICGRHQVELTRKLAVDHDHTSGKVRGLLCGSCNTHLGIYERSKDSFESYLNK